MKKLSYKLIIGLSFAAFATFGKFLFMKNDGGFGEILSSKEFWTSFLLFFCVGYVLLGNIFYGMAQKRKR